MVILTEEDKKAIAAHGKIGAMKYAAFPDSMKKKHVAKFMDTKTAARVEFGEGRQYLATDMETVLLIPKGVPALARKQ